MKYEVISADNNDISYLKNAKLYSIFNYACNLKEEEIFKINKYIDKNIPVELKNYKIITCNNKRIGCYLVIRKDDGVILDEIFLEEEYRNKGIGTNVIRNILKNNSIVYLWVYKENVKAIALYEKSGFNIVDETETRYYMKCSK